MSGVSELLEWKSQLISRIKLVLKPSSGDCIEIEVEGSEDFVSKIIQQFISDEIIVDPRDILSSCKKT